jgi:outer membrane lipoprotein-sorting protein
MGLRINARLKISKGLLMQRLTYVALVLPLLLTLNACTSNTGTPPPNLTPSPTAAATTFPKEEAEKLIQQLATQGGAKDSSAEMRLSFTDADGKPQQMDFRLQRKYEGDKVSTLMTVLAPKEESEKALLAFEEEGKPTDAISYLAGLKKITRLKSDNPLNFRGSKSTVQEMLGMQLGKYEIADTRVVTESGATEGERHIELKAKSGMSLSYPKIIVAFGADGTTVKRFELYDSRGEKVKTIVAREVKTIQDYPTITLMEIEDHKNKQQLKLETRSIKYNTDLPSSLFTEANLIKIVTAASQKAIQ